MQQFTQEIVSDPVNDAEIDRYEGGNETNGQPRNHQVICFSLFDKQNNILNKLLMFLVKLKTRASINVFYLTFWIHIGPV